jgi:hypothetical protein
VKPERACASDGAAAEIVGALILFGIFVATIAILNVTAVPQSGASAEANHNADVLQTLNNLQASEESIAQPTSVGAVASAAVQLSPTLTPGRDFMSYFLATPAAAPGEIRFEGAYGNLTLSHTIAGGSAPIVDVGSLSGPLPTGRFVFDPHPIFTTPITEALEDGAVLTTDTSSQTVRFAPPISVKVASGSTAISVLARVYNGTGGDFGGTTTVRVALTTQVATLTNPTTNDANGVTLRLETSYGSAWGAWLNATSVAAGLPSYTTTVTHPAGKLDVVTWTVTSGATNGIRLTSGLAVYGVTMS